MMWSRTLPCSPESRVTYEANPLAQQSAIRGTLPIVLSYTAQHRSTCSIGQVMHPSPHDSPKPETQPTRLSLSVNHYLASIVVRQLHM